MHASLLSDAWLCPKPGAAPDRQLLCGDPFVVAGETADWVKGISEKDGYEGWLAKDVLAPAFEPSHKIMVRSTWGFAAPDIKSKPLVELHMSTRLQGTVHDTEWFCGRMGESEFYLPAWHVQPWGAQFDDPVSLARQFVGTPYLWAGNTARGIDCSGLVQVAFHASGFTCAPDSKDQAEMAGKTPAEPRAGDLIFWKGHVAMETGEGTLVHANAHHMQVVEEERETAIARIAKSETGAVSSRLRPDRNPLESIRP